MDFRCFYFPLFCIHWLMGDDLLPADIARYADDIRPVAMGVLSAAEMGRFLGKMADALPDGTFLRGHALLRGIISMYNSLIISIVILQNTST